MTSEARPMHQELDPACAGLFKGLKAKQSTLLWSGILFVVAGLIALAFPVAFSLSVELLIGVTFLVAGISAIIGAFSLRGSGGGFWPVLLAGIVSTLVGVFLLAKPFAGLVALTMLFGAGLMANGLSEIYLAFKVRPQTSWWLLLLSGIFAVVFSLVIAFNLGVSSMILIGTLVGVNFLFSGIAHLGLWGAVRKLPDAPVA